MQDVNAYERIEDIPIVFEDEYVNENKDDMNLSIYGSTELEDKLSTIADIVALGSSKGEEVKKPIERNGNSGKLFILVHGFQATSYDMKSIRNHLMLRYPDGQYLCSIENENDTNGDISEMGTKLACEVVKFIKRYFSDIRTLDKIIFIGHSLGGIIIRTALPLLSEYKSKMHTLITFSSPHLGCYYPNSTIVNAGLWLLQK